MTDDFANHPVSITEAKADREHDCTLWTPRDALISLLRDIDSGAVKPDALVCVYRFEDDDGAMCSRFVNATPDCHTALRLLTRGQFLIMS